MKLPFDGERAERCLVRVMVGRHAAAMGFRLGDDDLIATACHCLPCVDGKMVLPDPNDPGAPLPLSVREWSGRGTFTGLVVAADPCGDLALVSDSTRSGCDLSPSLREPYWELLTRLEPAIPVLAPSPSGDKPVFLFTHTGKWLKGSAFHESITLENPRERIRPGTSGAPVFNEQGMVLGVVSTGTLGQPEGRMALLADYLPGWALHDLRPRTFKRVAEPRHRRSAGSPRRQ